MFSCFPVPTLKISHRLIVGFAIVVILLATSVGLSVRQLDVVVQDIKRIDGLRVPTASASANMTKNIYASLAALRGWMLTGNTNFKVERAAIWTEIAEERAKMDALSKKWTVPANKLSWEDFKAILAEFEVAQAKVEAIANSPDEHPATKMLIEQAAPRAAEMVKSITKMIDDEVQASTDSSRPGDRVKLLGMIADIRGTLGIGLANIRTYLLTGQQKFADNFDKLWRKNDRRFADLQANVSLLTPGQRKAFDAFAAKRTEFTSLPPKMFEIRGSKKWNMAQFTLVAEAVPRAGKLLTILLGAKSEDGSRAGGMQTIQARLLTDDSNAADKTINDLSNLLWLILGIGVLVSIVVMLLTRRSIVPPVVGMTNVMKMLAGGNLEVDIPEQGRKDEIGDMARAVQVFKENTLRARELEAEQEATKRKLKAKAESLSESEGRLEIHVAELQRANTELKRFAFVASHDLQEPLRKLRQSSEFLQNDRDNELSEDSKYCLDTICRSSKRMSKLIKDLLAYSHTANRDLNLSEVDLSEVTANVLNELEIPISESNATFQIGKLPTVIADSGAVGHLIRNLIGNAIKYRDTERDTKIEISSRRLDKEGALELLIADNGIGFDMEHSERIFEPFQRLHSKSDYPGSGIGLAVCNAICHRHDWKLAAVSTPGYGSVFSVVIPDDKRLSVTKLGS